jgi:hypothetical protein
MPMMQKYITQLFFLTCIIIGEIALAQGSV